MDSCIARCMKCREDTGKPLLNSTFVSSRKCYFLVRCRPYRNHKNVKLSQLINAVKGIILGKSLNGLGVLRLSIWSFLFISLLWLLREKEWCVYSIKVQFSIHWSNFLNHYNLKNSRLQIITRVLFNSQQLSTLNMILAQCQQLLERTGETGKKARNLLWAAQKKKKKMQVYHRFAIDVAPSAYNFYLKWDSSTCAFWWFFFYFSSLQLH